MKQILATIYNFLLTLGRRDLVVGFATLVSTTVRTDLAL